jgi:SAM-dependent methyltransferase
MNAVHHWICRSGYWRSTLQKRILPWALDGVDLSGPLLEIGPGFGMATDVLRERVSRLVAVEIDARLARSLAARLRTANASIIQGDGTALPFPDACFNGAVCFTMLHHVPSTQLQDQLLAEVRRVLKPGGTFAGSDSRWSRAMQWIHYRDTLVAIDPDTFAARLERAGFTGVRVDAEPRAFRFSGRSS